MLLSLQTKNSSVIFGQWEHPSNRFLFPHFHDETKPVQPQIWSKKTIDFYSDFMVWKCLISRGLKPSWQGFLGTKNSSAIFRQWEHPSNRFLFSHFHHETKPVQPLIWSKKTIDFYSGFMVWKFLISRGQNATGEVFGLSYLTCYLTSLAIRPWPVTWRVTWQASRNSSLTLHFVTSEAQSLLIGS